MDESLLIFDYFKPGLGKGMDKGHINSADIEAAKRVYVFVSHSHHDHYSPLIFGWEKYNENITFLLDDTVKKTHPKAVKMMRGDEYEDGYISVKEFGSTDIGGSFYVECEGKKIYHAGDFNFWHWRDEGDERYTRQMKLYFDRELKFLESRTEGIDIAFFPVDRRMGSGYDEGADIFIEKLQPSVFVPIHFLSFDDTKAFAAKHEDGPSKVCAVSRNGERVI